MERSRYYLIGFILIVGIGGGLLGSWVMGVYLSLADMARLNSNELFAAQRDRGYKNFLRMHLGGDGVLTIYPVGLRHTARKWSLRTGGDPADTWFVPDKPLEPTLIEAPVIINPW